MMKFLVTTKMACIDNDVLILGLSCHHLIVVLIAANSNT